MEIKKITARNGSELEIRYKCELCNSECDGKGSDTLFFYRKVLPNTRCPTCNVTTSEAREAGE